MVTDYQSIFAELTPHITFTITFQTNAYMLLKNIDSVAIYIVEPYLRSLCYLTDVYNFL